MKALQTLLAFVAVALASACLREWIELDALHGTNQRWSWLRSVILHDPPEHLDYAFIGSSKTLNAIQPLQLAEEIPGSRSLNLAHFDYGHDADYYVAEHLLTRHRVDRLVIEIPYLVVTEPHSATKPLIGLGEFPAELRGAIQELGFLDVLTYSKPLRARIERLSDYLATLGFSLPKHVLLFARAQMMGESYALQDVEPRWGLGRGTHWADAKIKQKKRFVDYWASHRHLPTPTQPEVSRPDRAQIPARGSRQDLYLHRLKALAAANNTQLTFLQIPSIWRPPPSYERYAYYRGFGDVLVPDLRLIYRFEHYADSHHLFGKGAALFNHHVAELLTQGPAVSPYHRHYLKIEAEFESKLKAQRASRDERGVER